MPVLSDDIQLTAPAPGPVMGVSAQITGPPGLATYFYWWVATYPIGVTVVSAPLQVRSAPTPLTATNFVTITGQPALGATIYDLLRTNTPQLPSTAANIAVATGLTSPTFKDQGAALTAYNLAGLAAGAPVSAFINLNNRDFTKPTLVVSPFGLAVPGVTLTAGGLTFPDGSTQTTAPSVFTLAWTEYTVELVGTNWVVTSSANPSTIVTPTAASPTQDLIITTFPPKAFAVAARGVIINGPSPTPTQVQAIGNVVNITTNPGGSFSFWSFQNFALNTAPGPTAFSDFNFSSTGSVGNSTIAAVPVTIRIGNTTPGNVNAILPPIKFSISILWSVTP